MIISLGSSPKVIEAINRFNNYFREITFFDNVLCNLETVYLILNNINTPITETDLINTNRENNVTGNKIINHINMRLSFISDFPLNEPYNTYMPVFLNKINTRMFRLKNTILNNSCIDFIHCLDDDTNFNFKCNPNFKQSNIYVPNNQTIHNLVDAIKKINPNLQFKIHIIVNPLYSNDNKILLDTLNNPYIKLYYIKDDPNKLSAGNLSLNWCWNTLFDEIKYSVSNVVPSDFDPVYYKKIYPDISKLSNEDATKHYLEKGIKEDRIYKIDDEIIFDPVIYKKIYSDIAHMTDDEAKLHYLKNGIKENRKYKYEDIFNPKTYRNLYPDLKNLNDREVTQHFYQHGINENRRLF